MNKIEIKTQESPELQTTEPLIENKIVVNINPLLRTESEEMPLNSGNVSQNLNQKSVEENLCLAEYLPQNSQNSENIDNSKQEPKEIPNVSEQNMSPIERKKLIKEIDRSVRKSLEEMQELEEKVEKFNEIAERRDSLKILLDNNESSIAFTKMFDESFGWARTQYECELCCTVYSIQVSNIVI